MESLNKMWASVGLVATAWLVTSVVRRVEEVMASTPSGHCPRAISRRTTALLLGVGILVMAIADPIYGQVGFGAASTSTFPGSVQQDGFSSVASYSNFRGGSGSRASLAGWRAYAETLEQEKTGDTMQWGPVALTLGAGAQVIFDSNINASPDAPLSDIILVPSILLGVSWPITRRNRLDLDLNLAYQYYLIHPEYANSGLTISPQSDLEFHLFTGDFVFTLYNYPTLTTGPAETDPALVNTGFFRQFFNRAGVRFLWDWNKLITQGGVERIDTFSLDSTFDSLNSTSYLAYLQISYLFTPTIAIGSRLVLGTQEFSSRTLNNSVWSQIGAFLDMKVSSYTSVYCEIGIQGGDFDNNAPRTDTLDFAVNSDGFNTNVEGTLGGGDYLQPYFIIGATNRLNKYMTHDLFVSRRVDSSSVSDYREQYTFAYGFQYRLNRLTILDGLGSLEIGRISASTTAEPNYFEACFRVGLGFTLTRDATLGLSYDYCLSSLNGAGSNNHYTRQRIILSTRWTF